MQDRDEWLEGAMARYEQSLVRLCCAYLGDVALAEDAVQTLTEPIELSPQN